VVGDVAGQQLARKGGLDVALVETLERPRAKDRVVAGSCDVFARGVGQLQLDVPVGQPLERITCWQADALANGRTAY
jgi:hypothetical protein